MARSKSKKEVPQYEDHEIEVVRAREWQPKKGDPVCFVDLTINGVSINGCMLRDGKNGSFISFPSYQGSDKKYYNHVWVGLSENDIKQIEEDVDKLLDEDEDK